MSDSISEAPADSGDMSALSLVAGDIQPINDPENLDLSNEDGDSGDDGEEQFELKVNGKTVQVPRSQVIADAQKYQATAMKLETAKKEVEQARTMQNQFKTQQTAVQNLLGYLQRGEFGVISEFVAEHLGGSDAFDKAAMKYAVEKYQYSQLPPAERKAMELERKVRKYETEQTQRAEREKQQAFQMEVNKWSEHIAIEMPKALATVGLPDTKLAREYFVSAWRGAIERNQSPTPAAVANYVKKIFDEAKMSGNPITTAPAGGNVRPRATPESVGMKRGAKDTGYVSMDEWKKTRGR